MTNPIGRVAAILAAVATAALASPFAGAQTSTVTVQGLVWFDRDADGVVDEGEPPKVRGAGVRVFNATTKEFIGEYNTDDNGRYRAEVPDVPLAIYSGSTARFESTTKSTFNPVTGGGTFDFGIRGGTISGFSFVDADRDGVRQAGEEDVPGDGTRTLFFHSNGLNGPGVVIFGETRGPNGEFVYRDLAFGDYVLRAADREPDLILAPPLPGGHDLPQDTREKALNVFSSEPLRVDARYVRPDADFVVGTPVVEPAKDAYALGDEVTLTVPVTNRGEAADRPSFVMFGSTPTFVSASDNVVVGHPGQDFALHEPMAVGETVELRLTYRLDNPEFEEFHLFARPVSLFNRRDVNSRDNHAIVPLKYLPAETTTTTPTSTTTSTTGSTSTDPTSTDTSTTTSAAAGQVGGGSSSGLAQTGVSPMSFLAAGGLLVLVGALAFLVARKRRVRA